MPGGPCIGGAGRGIIGIALALLVESQDEHRLGVVGVHIQREIIGAASRPLTEISAIKDHVPDAVSVRRTGDVSQPVRASGADLARRAQRLAFVIE